MDMTSLKTSLLTNGICEQDDFFRNGVPPSPFTLSTPLSTLTQLHSHIDPFETVVLDLKNISISIKDVIGSDHPVLCSVATYFFTTGDGGKRFRPTIIFLMARATNCGLVSSSSISCTSSNTLSATSDTTATSTSTSTSSSSQPSPIETQSPAPQSVAVASTSPSLSSSTLTTTSTLSASLSSSSLSPAPTPTPTLPLDSSIYLTPHQHRLCEIAEMIHTASLLHDDVIDDATTRRSVPSINSVFGNKVAILGGDFLLARSCIALAHLRNPDVSELLSLVIEHLVKGEIMQMKPGQSPTLDGNLSSYITKSYYKTASLIANSCKAVAILGGHDDRIQQIAYEYGKNVGLAFQIIDDIIDFTSTSEQLGKPALNDKISGVITAPLLYALHDFPDLQEAVNRKFKQPGDVEKALSYLDRSHGLARARSLAITCCENAVAAVLQLNPSTSQSALIHLVEKVLNRQK